MEYLVKTPVFEGPLDLLLRLITDRQVEITEVSLADLVNEYLAHLEVMRTFDLEVTSEFLVIASTLIQLKARRLLPGSTPADLDEDLALAEERDRLLSRLLACLTFKDVAAVLSHRMEAMARMFGRYAGLDPGISGIAPQIRLTVTPAELSLLAARLLRRPREPEFDHVDLDLPSVAEAIDLVRARVAGEIETDFDRITSHLTRPVEVVAYFLAVLELARWGLLEAVQPDPTQPIALRHRKDYEGTPVSEWHR
jgi:segregation and condensation protein A